MAILGLALTGCSTAIGSAGENCSGTKPVDLLLEEIQTTEAPKPESDESVDSNEFEEQFNGVVTVEDSGKTLIVNTKSTDDDPLGISSLALECVCEQLDVPSHISERISVTRALDGRQQGSWDGYTVSWSYHPDSGANVIFVQD
ncbi:hypothetical protein WDU99_02910 [Microbacterium sp. Mu-80]|uniref:Lipoprotein n=1 Tax=Microbacterium bandirmense TaxID=3122050 RepID=A0ABU8L7G3_9MICO